MKTLLSAKLSEGRIIVVDNDDIPERKTRHVSEFLSNFSEADRYLYVTGHLNEDFKVACKNIERVTYTTFDEMRIIDILKNDKIMMNLDGILNLMRFLHEQTVLLHKPRGVKFEGELTTEIQRAKDLKSGKVPTEKVAFCNVASL